MSLIIDNPNRDFEFISGLGAYEEVKTGNFGDWQGLLYTTRAMSSDPVAIRRKHIGASYDQCLLLPFNDDDGNSFVIPNFSPLVVLTGSDSTNFMFKARVRVMQLTHNKMYDLTKADDYSFKLTLAVTTAITGTTVDFSVRPVVDAAIVVYKDFIVHPNEGWVDLYLFCNYESAATLNFCVLPTVDQADTVLLLDSWHIDYSEYE